MDRNQPLDLLQFHMFPLCGRFQHNCPLYVLVIQQWLLSLY